MYKTEKFQKRPLEKIKSNINNMATIYDEIAEIGRRRGGSEIRRVTIFFLFPSSSLGTQQGRSSSFDFHEAVTHPKLL